MPAGMINQMGNQGSPIMQPMPDGAFMPDNMHMSQMYQQRVLNGAGGPGMPAGQQSGNHALQDYQMQLMLLEQQNKKRLMMARQEQDSMARDGSSIPPGAAGMQAPGMSPSGSRSGTSPNPSEQMKRGTPQIGGLPGSPADGKLCRHLCLSSIHCLIQLLLKCQLLT